MPSRLQRSVVQEKRDGALPNVGCGFAAASRAGARVRRTQQGGQVCRLVLKSHPGQTDALHLLAVIALETGNFAEADRWFRAVLAIHPHSQQMLLNHSIALCERGRCPV